MGKILKWLALDHRSLGQQRLFWIAMGLPVALFFIFGLFSWIESSPQWDYKGFNHFIDRSKLALGLLALALPFTALVTSWHRSIQTAKQIEESQVKNKADLYYAHKKFFVEQMSKIEGIKFPLRLYCETYPLASPENEIQTISENMKDKITNKLSIIEKEVQKIFDIFSTKDSISIDKNETKQTINKSLQKSQEINQSFYLNQPLEEDILQTFTQTLNLVLHVMDTTNYPRPLNMQDLENKIQKIGKEAKSAGIEQHLRYQ